MTPDWLAVHLQTLLLSLEERDAEEIILVLRGYHKLLTDRVLPVHRERTRWTQDSGESSFSSVFLPCLSVTNDERVFFLFPF